MIWVSSRILPADPASLHFLLGRIGLFERAVDLSLTAGHSRRPRRAALDPAGVKVVWTRRGRKKQAGASRQDSRLSGMSQVQYAERSRSSRMKP